MRGESESDVPGKIFVGGLSKDVDEPALEKLFARYGKLVEAIVIKDKETKEPRGFGFVTYENPTDATDAINGLMGKVLNGSTIRCQQATKPRNSQGGRGDMSDRSGRGGRGGRGSFGMGRGGGGDRGMMRGGGADRFRDGGRSEGGRGLPYARERPSRDYEQSYEEPRYRDSFAQERGYPSERREYASERREYAPERREYAAERREYAPERREYAAERRAFPEERREYAASQDFMSERRERLPAREPAGGREHARRDYPPSRDYADERDLHARAPAREYPSAVRESPREYGNGRDYAAAAVPSYEREYGSREARAPVRHETREYDRYEQSDRRVGSAYESFADPHSGSRASYGTRDTVPSRDLPSSRGMSGAYSESSRGSYPPARGGSRAEPRGPPSRGPPAGREPPSRVSREDPYGSYSAAVGRDSYPPRRAAGGYDDEPAVKRARAPPSYGPPGGGASRYGR